MLAIKSLRAAARFSNATSRRLNSTNAPNSSFSKIERLALLHDKFAASTKNLKPPSRFRGELYHQAINTNAASTSDRSPESLPITKDLPKAKSMVDSYTQMDLLFSQDPDLRESYVGSSSKVRMGRLMEDFDSIAGTAAYRHCLPAGALPSAAHSYGFYLVTAAVDRMDMLRPLEDPITGVVPDLRLSGHVSFTTDSSLEVFVRLSTIPSLESEKEPVTILLGRFAMAARKVGGGKYFIPKLLVEGPEEEELYRDGEKSKETKLERSKTSLEKVSPNEKEAALMHGLFVGRGAMFERNAPTPEDVVWMSDTALPSSLLMHPSERNIHLKIFGGYLMRLAYELAYSTSCLFAKSTVSFLALDELVFTKPVEIGTLLVLNSKISYSPNDGRKHKSFHVSVEAGTTNLYTGEKQITNTFHFTFISDKPLVRTVLPRSYKESMSWLDGMRRREAGISIRKDYDKFV